MGSEPLADQIVGEIDKVRELYHRLVLVVAPSGAGKTAALQDVHNLTEAPLRVNVATYHVVRHFHDVTELQMGNH